MKIRWLFAALLSPSVCFAQGPEQGSTSVAKDADAYCAYVKGVAHSTSVVEYMPRAFGTYGTVDGVITPGATIAITAEPQVIVGGTYSLSGLYRGIEINAQASAECDRYRAESGLHAFVEANRLGLSTGALRARLAVLDDALPHAAEILKDQQQAMTYARTTLEILEATQLRVDQLRDLDALAHRDLESLQTAPQPPKTAISDLIKKHDELEAEVERHNAHIRQSQGWDIAVRGGWDKIFDVRDFWFVSATLTISLGFPFQFGPDGTAIDTRPVWINHQIEGADDRATQLASVLRAELRTEQDRLRQTQILLADLEQRFKATVSIPGDLAKRAAEALWFDLIKVKSDHEYFRVHVEDLKMALGEQPPKGANP